MKTYIIYKITNLVNGKVYIGRTTQTLAVRWANHKSSTNAKKNLHLKLYKAFKKYGIDNFKCEQIHEVFSFEELRQAERQFIISNNSTDDNCGYNMSMDCDRGLEMLSQESIDRKRASLHKANASRKIAKHGIGVRNIRNNFYANISFERKVYTVPCASAAEAMQVYDMLAVYFYKDSAQLNDPTAVYSDESLLNNYIAAKSILDRTYKCEYYGVTSRKLPTKTMWDASISKDKVLYKLGRYTNPEDAAEAVDMARIALEGESAHKFNFPERKYATNTCISWFNEKINPTDKDVRYEPRIQKYFCALKIGNKTKTLCYHPNKTFVAQVRDMAVIYYGLGSSLNYPDKIDYYNANYVQTIEHVLKHRYKKTLN
jgi:GIY-YIG catalytic domain